MRRDLHNNIKVVRALSPVALTDATDQTSQIIDTTGFDSVEFIVATGTLAAGAATFTASLEHGDAPNLSDAGAVGAADLIGAAPVFDQTDDDEVFKVGYKGGKRYVRLKIAIADNNASAPIAAVAVLGHARTMPVA